MTEFNHRDRRLTHDHYDAYEGSFVFKSSLLEPDALWDDEAEASACDQEGCWGYLGLREAISVLAEILRAGFEPRSVSEAWSRLHRVRELDRWFDAYESQIADVEGAPRLAICLAGCSLHRVYVVDLPEGWTVSLDLENLEVRSSATEGGREAFSGEDFDIDAISTPEGPPLREGPSPSSAVPVAREEAVSAPSDSRAELLGAIDLIVETASLNASMLRQGVDPELYVVVSRRQLEALKALFERGVDT